MNLWHSEKSREKSKIEAPDFGTPSINSFFKMQTSSADIPAAAAVVRMQI